MIPSLPVVDGSDEARLERKMKRLLTIHPNEEFMSILRDLTNIKDEMISLLDFSNAKLEKYIDIALAHS